MQDRDREKFLRLMNSIAAPFGVEVSEALLDGYWLGLEDLPIERVAQGVASAIKGATRMPRPAEIRELSGDVATGSRAVKAWVMVKDAIRSLGAYRSVDFDDDGITNATVRALGGWQRLCSTDSDELDKWTRKDFERIYAAFAQSGVSGQEGGALVGIHDRANGFNGYELSAPARVAIGLPSLPAAAKRIEAKRAAHLVLVEVFQAKEPS